MSYPKHVNHELSPMSCPVDLDDVDIFGQGAQEHWYCSYEILHRDAPVLRLEGRGLTPGTDAFVLTKHADVNRVVRDPDRFKSMTQARIADYAAQGLTPEETFDQYHKPHAGGDGVAPAQPGDVHQASQGADRPLGRHGCVPEPGHDHQARERPA